MTTLQHTLDALLAAIAAAGTPAELEAAEKQALGKDGALQAQLRGLKDLPEDERKAIGAAVNQAKEAVQAAAAARRTQLAEQAVQAALAVPPLDATLQLPAALPAAHGAMHVLYQTQYIIEDVFTEMGFTIADGPELENEYYNFDALNIPATHPARDKWDTFFVKGSDQNGQRLLLRTHTSNMQVRMLRQHGAPLRFICPGRVYRNEATDATHEHTFDQVEGLVVDKGITMAHMVWFFELFLGRIFGQSMQVRLRPSFFPFTEPSVEVDCTCPYCSGKGCSVCKRSGWIELMGAGMVHPHVLREGGVDPEVYTGFAFGFGLTRMAAMRHGVPDIRLLTQSDTRFVRQW